ncbi:hypothetical protein Ancab_002862 [Ancistrocladus abbreviatus]
MTRAELVLIPLPVFSHLKPMAEAAKRLAEHDERISTTVLVINLPNSSLDSQIKSLEAETSTNNRIKLVKLPELQNPNNVSGLQLIEDSKQIIKKFVVEHVTGSGSGSDSGGQLAGLVVDALCTSLADVADELNVPCYMFFPSTASLLSLMIHFKNLSDNHGVDLADEFKHPDKELEVPGFRNRVPGTVLPLADISDTEEWKIVLSYARMYPKVKGMLVNSFTELESRAIHSLLNEASVPPIYPVGPILNLDKHSEASTDGLDKEKESIVRWLDEQPQLSVIFLCFGSRGSLVEEQAREVASGLERSGHRFLWSLRRPHSGDEKVGPHDYENLQDVLPMGFLDRTAKIGKVIGWAPQVTILSHPAVGCFVSHCGWNSILESLWFGVPVVAWPMYAEQQMNAFLMVRELELAGEIRIDYRWNYQKKLSNGLVEAEVIERGVRKVMDGENGVRNKVMEIREVSRKCIMEGGSSYIWLGRFIEDAINNISY